MYASSPHTIHPPHMGSAIFGESVIIKGFLLIRACIRTWHGH